MGNTFRYKGFDLNLQFTGQFGYQILNAQRSFYENNSIAYNRLKSTADWHPAINADGTPLWMKLPANKKWYACQIQCLKVYGAIILKMGIL